MAGFKCHAHDIDIADTFKGIIRSAACDIDNMPCKITFDFRGINEIRHTEFAGNSFAVRVDVHADNLLGPNHLQALNDV